VVDSLRLADGTLFPIPITLDVSHDDVERLSIYPGRRIALRDPRDDEALAVITVDDLYIPNRVKEAIQVFGADDVAHPSVAYLHNRVKDFYIGGKVQAIQAPTHFDYVALRCTLLRLHHLVSTHIIESRYPCRTPLSFQKTCMAQGRRFPDS
jgi:sulfate adenylyltransferase